MQMLNLVRYHNIYISNKKDINTLVGLYLSVYKYFVAVNDLNY